MRKDLISVQEIKLASRVLRALNHDLRRRIIYLLDHHKKLMVTDIYVKLRIEQSLASQQLATLRQWGIVRVEREGKNRYYSIVHSRLEQVNSLAKSLAEKNETIAI